MGAPSHAEIEEEFPPGTVFAGKYCVERVLGRGGMGAVLAARHMDLGHRVAIKVLHEGLASDPRATERFQREAKASVSLESEHVAHVMDVGTDHGTSYMVMEFLEGEDLASILKREERIPQEQAASWLLEACDAVAEAHAQGIIHRDLKPANLFLAKRKRGEPLIKVLDFGISKATLKSRERQPQEELTETQAIIGTPLYASPEQLRGDQGIDPRSDIWSLGVLLHRLLSGARPFDAETSGGLISAIAADSPRPVRDFVPDVDEGVERIIFKCLEKKPDSRFQSVAELARALEPFAAANHRGMASNIDELTVSVPPEPSTRRFPPNGLDQMAGLVPQAVNDNSAEEEPLGRVPLLVIVGALAVAVSGVVAATQMEEQRPPLSQVSISPPPKATIASDETATPPPVVKKPARPKTDLAIATPIQRKSPPQSASPTPQVKSASSAQSPSVPPPKIKPTQATTPRASAQRQRSDKPAPPPAPSTKPLPKKLPTIIESDPYAQ